MNKNLVLFFLLLLSFAHAQSQPTTYDTYTQFNPLPIWEEWNNTIVDLSNPSKGGIDTCAATQSTKDLSIELIKNSGIALFIIAMAIALMYMAGQFFQLPHIIALSKSELNELMITAVVAILVIGFLSTLGFNFSAKAMAYSYKMLYKVSHYSSILITANVVLNSIYTAYIPIGPIRRALTIQLGPALRPIIDAVSFSLQFLITTFGEWVAFTFIFCFIEKWFLPLFFPVGLFLRSFPQTRAGGNALIGFALSLSTVYPFMFAIDDLIFEKQFPQSMQLSVDYFLSVLKTIIMQLTIGGVGAIFGMLSLIYISPIMIAALIVTAYMFLDVLVEVLHLIVIFSLVLPVLNIFITLSMAREFSRLLGTEISISAFAKLI